MDLQYFIELLFGGLTRGSIYALIALGYTLVYGIIGLINFAHGEIYMVGAFTALLVAGWLGYIGFPAGGILLVAALAAVAWTAAYGFTLEKVAYKPLRSAPRLSPLISAIGMSIFLQNYVLLAQTSDFVPFPDLVPEMPFLSYIGDVMGPTDFLILVVILQQLDGNVIGPSILGNTTGLQSFWVMFAIIVGGGFFGFVGMVVGVPVFAVIYYYGGRLIRRRLKHRHLPEETKEYMTFDKYNIDRKDILE